MHNGRVIRISRTVETVFTGIRGFGSVESIEIGGERKGLCGAFRGAELGSAFDVNAKTH